MLRFLFFICNIAVCFTACGLVANIYSRTRTLSAEEKAQRGLRLPQDRAVWYIRLYSAVFQTQNLNTVVSIMTDIFYHTVASTIRGLNKLGLRREWDVEPYPPDPKDVPDYDFVSSEGKSDISGAGVYCRVTERYVDTTTGQVLSETFHNRDRIGVTVLRSNARAEGKAIQCVNCGADVDTSGEIFICKYCGTTYRADSYDWSMSALSCTHGDKPKALKTPRERVFDVFYMVIVCILMFGPIFFAGVHPFINYLFIAEQILIPLIAVVAGIIIVRKKQPYKVMYKFDPLSSEKALANRAAYLMQRFNQAYDFNLADIRPMMDARMFEYIASAHNHNGTYVLDLDGVELKNPHFYIKNGWQNMDVTFSAMATVLTPQRRVGQFQQKLRITLYRNENTRYEHQLHMQSYACPGCGASLDMTANSACKYCGTEYDTADFDWKLGYVDMNAYTRQRVAKTLLDAKPVAAETMQALAAASRPALTVQQGAPTQPAAQGAPPHTAAPAPFAQPAQPRATTDTGPERILDIIEGYRYFTDQETAAAQKKWEEEGQDKKKKPKSFESCFWVLTSRRIGCLRDARFDKGPDGRFIYGLNFQPTLDMLDDPALCIIAIPLNLLHSILCSRTAKECCYAMFLYTGECTEAGFTDNATRERFRTHVQSLVPDLGFVVPGANYTAPNFYRPSISELDPRNPFGTRYNPDWPRNYVVVHTDALKDDPHSMDEAIGQAIQAGILPANFDLATHGFGINRLVPGVPCILSTLKS